MHGNWDAEVAHEIRKSFNSGVEICNGLTLSGYHNLRAAIEESLRLSPPSIASLWRTGDPKINKTFVVDGNIKPPGTEVAVNLRSIYHTSQYFPEPFCYRPDRWVEP